ncbi:unnamed protein product [Microthlaspi erraticum]|uniref:Uncharacterized protein n=1 Tax=Microthlaspi erraticum TaxID=1685480 RepID=A0A6D2JN59_9BRAS|nr:unnamed protein product [Microthlaspi erraticum]
MNVFFSRVADATEPLSLHRRRKRISSVAYSNHQRHLRRNLTQQPQSKRSKFSARKLASRLQKCPPQGQAGPVCHGPTNIEPRSC